MFEPLKALHWLSVLVVVAVMVGLPLVTQDTYLLHVLVLAMVFGVFASAWNFVTGFAGLKTFGHHAFFALGAYGSALIGINAGISPWVTIWLGGLIAAVAGLLIGLPVLRIRSMPHVAIVTLGFAEIVRITLSNLTEITRGELGLWGIPAFEGFTLPGIGEVSFSPADKMAYYYLALILLLLSMVVITALMRSKTGLSIIAMRDSDDAAESLGINLTRLKLLIFVVSSFLVGVAGAFYAHYISILTPTAVAGVDLMILIIAMVLVGGLSTLTGPLVGALILTILVELLRDLDTFRLLIYGALIIFSVMFLPRGLVTIGEFLPWRRRSADDEGT